MAEKRKWVGITQNDCVFQGEIIADPQESGEFLFMTLRTLITDRDANGQYTDTPVDVLIMAEPGSPQQNTIRNYVKAGRKLLARCNYKTWVDAAGAQQAAFVVRGITLGDKPYEGPKTPGLPSN
jgi:hypothetical protein